MNTPADPLRRPKRATIVDVALACRLSKTTISKVMNVPAESLDLPESTRQRVLKAAEELGYRPSWRARAFASRKTHTIGLLHELKSTPLFRGDLWYDIVFALSARFYDAGYDVQLVGIAPERKRWRSMLLDQRLDGCVVFNHLTSQVAGALKESQLPAVLLNTQTGGQWTEIVTDDEASAAALANHLIELGHRRIAFVDDQEAAGHFSRASRLTGIRSALKQAGLTTPVTEITGDADASLRTLLSLPAARRPTAVVAYHHLIALPFLHACWRAGLRVPEQLSVCTFNDVDSLRHSIPPLTTVKIPANEMAALGVELLLKQLSGPAATPRTADRVVLPGQLIVRQSTGRAAG